MIASMRAELLRLGRWPTMWLLSGTWLLLNLSFGYLFNYLTYRSEDTAGFGGGVSDEAGRQALLDQLLPGQVPVVVLQGLPMFGGALLLILGALAVGSGYGWGTWKSVFTTGPSRLAALGGTAGALGVVLVGLIVATFALDLAAATAVAAAEGQAIGLPSLGDSAEGLGAGLLIGGMWIAGGTLLGTLTRGPALAVGLGLLWAIVVESLLRGVSELLGPLQAVTDVLPGTAAGSLVGALGGLTQSEPNGTPGVTTILEGTLAAGLLAGYVVAFLATTLAVTLRRDIAT